MESLIQTVVDAVSLGSFYALLALGIALIWGIMQLANFANGELLTIASYVTFFMLGAWLPIVLVAAIAAAVLASLAMERLAFRPLRGAAPESLLIASFTVSFFLQNFAITVFTSSPRSLSIAPVFNQTWQIGGYSIAALSVITIAVTGALTIGIALLLKRSTVGVYMRAAAEDFEMARMLGVNANRVIAQAFAIAGVIGGVAGILYTAQVGQISPMLGLYPTIIGFSAAIVGGLASLPGAALGGMVLGALTIILQTYLPEGVVAYRDAILFVAVIGILLVMPQGLLGRRVAELRRV